jgi:two-component system, OmpR family, response regulator RegX3
VARVLVVEDEQWWSDPLSYMLRNEGFEVAVAATGLRALAEFDRNGADLVLLDLMLPGMSGVEVCRHLRARANVPIIIVSARDSEIDKVAGLEAGADDYVTKPYSMPELLARIRALLRRHSNANPTPASSILTVGPVRLDLEGHTATLNGSEMSLAPKEFLLLELLLRNAGRVLTRAQLIDRAWGRQHVADTRILDMHIQRLRSKIEADPSAPRHLQTVRGVGYRFLS